MHFARGCSPFREAIPFLFFLLNLNSFNSVQGDDLKAFKDFMDYNYFGHVIIIDNGCLKFKVTDFSSLFGGYYTRFLKTSGNKSSVDLTKIFDGSFSRAGIFLPIAESDASEDILMQASMGRLFNNTFSWWIVPDEKYGNIEFMQGKLKGLKIEVNSDVTVVIKEEEGSLVLYDVYRLCTTPDRLLTFEFKGNWSLENGLQIPSKFRYGLSRRRRNFCNSTVKTGTALVEKPPHLAPLEYLESMDYNRHSDMMQRKTYKLLIMMEPLFNMSFDILFRKDWGKELGNGTWTGVIGDIVGRKIEFAICPIRPNEARARVLLFTPELHTEHIRFILRHPRHATIRNIFFEPLSPTVWWCISALVIFLIMQLGIHIRLEYRIRKLQTPHIENRWDFIVLQILEVIFMQGPSPDLYAFVSTRTFLIAACIFSIMLQQFYSAFIVGSLLAAPSRTITSLEALYNSSLDIGMEQISYNYELFLNTTSPLVRDIYAKRICRNSAKNILTLEEGVERIGRGGFAFHVSLNRAYRLLIAQLNENAFCELQEIMIYPPFAAGVGAPKDAVFREYVATSTLLFRETGLLQYIEKQWSTKPIDCSFVQNHEVEVDLEHFAPALVLLATAMGISLVILLGEILWKYLRGKDFHLKSILG